MSEHKRVLLVDDDERVLFVLRHALARLGAACEIATATNGYDASQAIGDCEPDLLITDIRLPGPSGVELTEALRACGSRAQVVWITAHHEPGMASRARSLGVFRYLLKPLEIDEIRTVARAALAETGNPAAQ